MHIDSIPTVMHAAPLVPARYARLPELAQNLWWSRHAEARNLFRHLAKLAELPPLPPSALLRRVPVEMWGRVAGDATFAERYERVCEQFAEAIADPGPDADRGPTVAYFSTEYGWHESFPIYSGGLGVLSGDHTKAAADLGLPLIGIGLFYRRGYFRQTIAADGEQQHGYPWLEPDVLPLRQVAGADGEPLMLSLPFPGREVVFCAWLAAIGRVPVLLLDGDLPENSAGDRRITHQLYVQGREMRFCQEWLLGAGGVRLLERLGIVPDVWHLNEGHSALLSLERIGRRMREHGEDLEAARRRVAADAVFTTHTPVPAGNEVFEIAVARPFVETWAARCGADPGAALDLARVPGDEERFNLTALALRTAARSNGVSALHGRVAASMWERMLPVDGATASIESITNGVHRPTWCGESIRALAPHCTERETEAFVEAVKELEDAALWHAHETQKHALWDEVLHRLREQWGRHGAPPQDLDGLADRLQPEALTIGFARRFATYKRGDLIARDRERLARLLGDDARPVRLLFSGKAHPADTPGRQLIRSLHELAREPEFSGKIWFLESYDMQLGRRMVQGCDVWLNTPRRPLEASGTSGMKAAMNGALNLSVYDGWWCEGYDASHGWSIGPADPDAPDSDDSSDLQHLFELLETSVVPEFFDRDDDGLPRAWIARMKAALASLTPRFSARRMVAEYRDRFYRPLAGNGRPPDR